jgi:hypothetical protein
VVGEEKTMKTKMLALLFLAGGSLFAATHVYVGIGVGGGPVYAEGYYAPPPPPPAVYVPPCPGPGYSWVSGYWFRVGPRYSWQAGYWRAPYYGGGYGYGYRDYGRAYYRDHDRDHDRGRRGWRHDRDDHERGEHGRWGR